MGTYVRNAWYVASWAQDVEVGQPQAITILGERLVMWRAAGGSLHVLEDRCVHRLAALSRGRCEGDALRCMYHGLLFDPNGTVIEIPGQSVIPPNARVRSYPVAEQASWIWVWMGDAEAADTALIPDVIALDHPDYILAHGQLDYAAEARLINDNLLDFSHLSYVHPVSFGVDGQFADSPPRTMPLARGIRFERWFHNSGTDGTVESDGWLTYDYLIPGILIMWFALYPLGTAAALDFGRPRPEDALAFCNASCQAVTPMTDDTARYFFSVGPHRKFGDEEARDKLRAMTELAFEEDRAVIEEQQRVIDMTRDPVVMPTVHDKGVVLFNRLVSKLAASEDQGRQAGDHDGRSTLVSEDGTKFAEKV